MITGLRQAGTNGRPRGSNSSLFWDAKFVADAPAGQRWPPEKARGCGVMWAADGRT